MEKKSLYETIINDLEEQGKIKIYSEAENIQISQELHISEEESLEMKWQSHVPKNELQDILSQ